MTKQELLSTPAFQSARDDAIIYLAAWFDGGTWIRYVTVPKKEDQTRDCIRFRSFEPLISKKRLLANLSFRHSRGDKVLTFQYLGAVLLVTTIKVLSFISVSPTSA